MEAYLDNSATTKPCAAAVDAMVKCMTEGYYNPSSVYKPAVEAFQQVATTESYFCLHQRKGTQLPLEEV